MKQGIGTSHGKLILIGEHSVVYGNPAIAIPFRGGQMTVTLQESSQPSSVYSTVYSGRLDQAPADLDALRLLLTRLQEDYGMTGQSFKVVVKSTLPIERGLGSSAALSVALTKAFFDYMAADYDRDLLLSYVDYGETIAHGTPSGLDARVTASDQALIFVKDQLVETFDFHTPYWLVVADTGVMGQTKEAVQAVRAAYESPDHIRREGVDFALNRLKDLTIQLKDLLTSPRPSLNKLGSCFRKAQHYLTSLQVSSPELALAVEFCQLNGAAAAKLTGGGRGGSYFALVDSQHQARELAEKLEAQGLAQQTWLVSLSSQTTRKAELAND